MKSLEHYAPYLLAALGLLAIVLPNVAPKLWGYTKRIFAHRSSAPALPHVDPKREFVSAVLTVMESCERAGCTAAADTAKSLLTFVDQMKPASAANSPTSSSTGAHHHA